MIELNRIYQGDCADIMKQISNQSVNMIFADPPYNSLSMDAEVFADIYISWLDSWLTEAKRVLTLNGSIVFCGRPPFLNYVLVKALEKYFVLSDWVTWHKLDSITHSEDCFSRNYEVFAILNFPFVKRKFNVVKVPSSSKHYGKTRNIGSIWEHPKITAHHKEDTGHPTQKPELLVGYLIQALTDENDVVLDPFFGSGTTCAIAKKLGRQFIGIDINPAYQKIAQNRLDNIPQKLELFISEIKK
jgi:DNA modification methylase